MKKYSRRATGAQRRKRKTKKKLVNFFAGYSNSTFDTRTDPLSIRLMLDALSLGKSIGVRGVSHEMLKFNGSQKLVEAMAKLFDFMVNNQVCPEVFNVSIIKPLIKDSCKPNDEQHQASGGLGRNS